DRGQAVSRVHALADVPDALREGPLHGVLLLTALEPAAPETTTERACEALALVQTLVQAKRSLAGGLRLVTRGAMAATEARAPIDLCAAALWGLWRTVANEQPELGAAPIDLDPFGEDDLRPLLDELLIGGAAEQVALRRSGRLVARLARAQVGVTPPPGLPADDGPFHLAVTARGSFDGLTFQPIEHPAPTASGVEVAVYATGLNFRDVLNALGLYPGDPGPVGGEMAGVITRVGPGVTDLKPGEAVLGLAPAAFADRVLTDARLITRKPPTLSFEAAASIPLVYLTAWQALHRVAELRAGQRVLIHAATGGVGLAALAIAREIGAEIFATASPGKWPLLRTLGIDRPMNSRTTAFAEQLNARSGGVDVVLSALAGEGLIASLRALRPGGVLVDIAKNDVERLPGFAEAVAGRRYIAWDLGPAALQAPEAIRADLTQIVERLARGAFPAQPLTVWPIEAAVDAFRFMGRGQHVGKIVVSQVARRRRLDGLPARLRPDGAVRITGGTGGLGLRAAAWLA
ncbi:MAG: zinc-binding dehydrogenase, partial [Myxococcales bacterium]|nr:zinc-binding dehydrogenase [Myxococcales bacterium]